MSTEVSVSSSCSANVILLFDDLDASRQFKLVTANAANDMKALLERLVESGDAIINSSEADEDYESTDENKGGLNYCSITRDSRQTSASSDDSFMTKSQSMPLYQRRRSTNDNMELTRQKTTSLEEQNRELGRRILRMQHSLTRIKKKYKRVKMELKEKKRQIMVLASHYVSEEASGGDADTSAAALVADGSNHNLDTTVDTQSTSDDTNHPLSLEDDGTDDKVEIYTDRIMSDDESQMDESAVSKIANNIKLTTSLEESSLPVNKLGGVSQSVINSYRPQRTAQTIIASTSDPQIMVSSSDDIQEHETDATGDSRPTVESLLSKVCNSLNFDIAEVWLHKGQSYDLSHSHIRPKSIGDSVYSQLEDIYHGKEESTKKFKHELSSSMCKWAKKTGKILWITTQTPRLSQALKYSISGVQMGVAVPVRCGGITATIIYFSMTSQIMEPFAPGAEDKLVAMSKKMLSETMPLKERHSRRSTM
jgi:hypothetical protein